LAQKLQAIVDETIRLILKVSVDTVLTMTSYSAEALLENYKHFKIFETIKVVFISKITFVRNKLQTTFKPHRRVFN
jgi:CO dehydrogenase nickel-insertion accessory protein CooC1